MTDAEHLSHGAKTMLLGMAEVLTYRPKEQAFLVPEPAAVFALSVVYDLHELAGASPEASEAVRVLSAFLNYTAIE